MGIDDVCKKIEEAMEEGIEVTGEDFEGRPCTYCGEMMSFTDWDPVTWDVRVQDPDQPEPEPYYARYYYCSEECKRNDKQAVIEDEEMHPYGEEDRIHEDDMEGMT